MKKLSFLILTTALFCSFSGNSQNIDTMINVGDHRLHFNIVKGEGTPILFEAGNGDDASVWKDILEPIHLATNATLITYDRAGLGKSEIDTTTISFDQEIEDLKLALKTLGYDDGIFIVSHSFGGFYSTRFSNQFDGQIKGMVYIDAALPCFFTEAWSRDFVNGISAKDWKLIRQYKSGLYFVLKNLGQISNTMQDQSIPVTIPVTLIAAENPPAMVKQTEQDHWKECLFDFGSLPNHSYRMAEGAGHKVWADNPKVVIDEIVKLYEK